MGHNPSDARTGKTSERKKIEETRTPEAIIKGIRGNLAAHLAVTSGDTAFLLAQFDALQVGLICQVGHAPSLMDPMQAMPVCSEPAVQEHYCVKHLQQVFQVASENDARQRAEEHLGGEVTIFRG